MQVFFVANLELSTLLEGYFLAVLSISPPGTCVLNFDDESID
jgi:hypothetical protein